MIGPLRLLIDLGNSRLKWALESPKGLDRCDSAAHEGGVCSALLSVVDATAPQSIWLSSVAGPAGDRLAAQLSQRSGAPIHRARSVALIDGIRNAYAEPEKLGVDRFLTLLGARQRFPNQALLIVDAGTALTVDLLDRDGRHLGGSIAPGLMLMRRSLGRGTASLGASDQPPPVALTSWGRDTVSAIEGGILAAAHGAIALRLSQAAALDPRLLLTGGDAALLAQDFADAAHLPQLVLEGLQRYAELTESGD